MTTPHNKQITTPRTPKTPKLGYGSTAMVLKAMNADGSEGQDECVDAQLAHGHPGAVDQAETSPRRLRNTVETVEACQVHTGWFGAV